MDGEEDDYSSEEEEPEDEVPDSSRFEWFQLVKVLTVLLAFVLCTALAVLSTGSTIFLVSQIRYPGYEQPSNPICSSTDCQKYNVISQTEDSAEAWMWVLMWALMFPEALTFLHALATIIGMQQNPLSRRTLFTFYLWIPLLFQTLHIIGILMLFYVALPHLSAVKMLMVTTSVCLLPSFLKCCKFKVTSVSDIVASVLNLGCLLIQVVSLLICIIFPEHNQEIWSLPLGLVLTSFGYWKAYLPNEDVKFLKGLFKKLRKVRDTKRKERNQVVNLFASLWSLLLSFAFVLVATYILKPVPEIPDLLGKLQWHYQTNVTSTVVPGPPPSIKLDESYSTDCRNFPYNRITVPKFAYPDESDCSAFWSRDCMVSLGSFKVTDTLSYNLCPEGTRFYSNVSVKALCREVTGELTAESCCQPESDVNCGDRADFDGCSNGPVFLSFPFPNETADFQDSEDQNQTNWNIPWESESSKFYPALALLVQIISTYLVFQISKFSCQGRIEVIGFALPVTLAPIITIISLVFLCFNYSTDACIYKSVFPHDLFFTCHELTNSTSLASYIADIVVEDCNWIFILAFLSQVWIAVHIWTVRSVKLARTEQIFSGSYYTSFLVIQSLLMNRKIDEKPKVLGHLIAKKKPKVIGCATMWHETANEMKILIKSVLHMDKNSTQREDEDKYDWETHIFFDDAIITDKKSGSTKVNEYVQDLLSVMKSVSNTSTKTETPYGGRLEWLLPYETKLVCHLKDKSKIRHKKRWSQCMYFLYFLNFQQHIDLKNTYLLALDGDMSFTSDAVTTLLDLLKRNERLGAACGRMHPTGSGFIAMYQKFEYAVGHWMQKATEDILGNVLCSPGCFSMFRGEALLRTYSYTGRQNTNKANRHSMKSRESAKPAMEEYMTVSTKPIHYIQYDQGEDRWLCTLLIKRGWRIKYCAISNSETACPETFEEFYNQRRRWTPSTVANLLEILKASKFLLKHGYLNIFHIFYQILTLLASTIGPGSIIVMAIGGLPIALNNITLWHSLLINMGIIFLYTLTCMLFSSKTQITAAKACSLIYGLLMIVILIGVIINAVLDYCIWAPATLTLEITVGAFLLVGLCHPLELKNLLYGFVYFVTIPCMYLFLPFYCVFNLDDVSWGTREAAKSAGPSGPDLSEKISNVFTAKKEIESLKQELTEIKVAFMKANPPKDPIENQLTTEEIDGSNQEKSTSWIDDRDLPENRKTLDMTEKIFWEEKIKKHLQPLKISPEKAKQIKEGLQALRSEVFVLFFFVNMGWAFIVFLLEINATNSPAHRLSLNWPFCDYVETVLPNNYALNSTTVSPDDSEHSSYITPINVVFLALFLAVLLIQLIGMFIHRIETVRHITTNTFIFCKGKTTTVIKQSFKRKNNDENNYYNTVNQQQPSHTQKADPLGNGRDMEMDHIGHEETDALANRRKQPRHAYTNKGFSDGKKTHFSTKLSMKDSLS